MEMVTILGLVAATFTTVSFLPQAIKTIKTKQTKDLSLGMYTILTIGVFLWLIYGLIIHDYPIILANAVTGTFSAIILINIIRYG
tara:strand:+ start:8299 stop:8553 length:255 start_codon:yes stop_codon:yes gene_type:complete